jgi:DNA (cytosine-5)-methyltransferase 1
MTSVTCVDLFCGVGGLSNGLLKGGIKVAAGIDVAEACQFAYEYNNKAKFLNIDVEQLTGNSLQKLFPKRGYRLLAGCAPCQPFSTYSQGRDTSSDRKWGLLRSFARLVRELQPEFVTMENVPQLPKHLVFEEFLKCFAGYHVWHGIVNCPEYGIPQRRKRLVLLASKLGPISLIPPTHKGKPVTVAKAIAGLPPLKAGETDPRDSLHTASRLNSLNLRRIRQSTPGGTWRDWDPELVADCHRKDSGSTYPGVYGRMEWNKPSPTMTTLCYGYGNGRFGHPEQDRAISLREAAIFQTFPRKYKFTPPGQPIEFRTIGRMIGNAVPVRLGEVIAKSIERHIRETRSKPTRRNKVKTAA